MVERRRLMLVLGIETSTRQVSVALGTATELVGAYLVGRGGSPDRVLVPSIERLLSDAGVGYRQLGGIAVGLGPGLFTGLRVGVATAKALAQALVLPVAGFSSLDLMAYRLRYSRRTICTCVDARRKEVFWAFYRPVHTGVQRVTEFSVGPPEHCAGEIEAMAEPVLAVGNGPLVYREVFEGLGELVEVAGVAESAPTAVSLTELAVRRFEREDSDRIAELRPLYVRKSDAELTWERAGHAFVKPRSEGD